MQHINRRYKKAIGEKIVQFLEQINPSLHNLEIKDYLRIIDEVIHINNKMIDLTFTIYDIS